MFAVLSPTNIPISNGVHQWNSFTKCHCCCAVALIQRNIETRRRKIYERESSKNKSTSRKVIKYLWQTRVRMIQTNVYTCNTSHHYFSHYSMCIAPENENSRHTFWYRVEMPFRFENALATGERARLGVSLLLCPIFTISTENIITLFGHKHTKMLLFTIKCERN